MEKGYIFQHSPIKNKKWIKYNRPSPALLDPSTWTPPVAGVTQIDQPFAITFDVTPAAVINPDPSNIGAGITVCYDLSYGTPGGGAFDTVLFKLTGATTLSVKYDPAGDATAQCANMQAMGFSAVDTSWVTYIR